MKRESVYGWLQCTEKVIIYIDESGNFDFDEKGSKYFILTAVIIKDTSPIFQAIRDYFYTCLERDDLQKFHACEDNRHIRNRVFKLIESNLMDIQIISFVFDKKQAHEEHKNHLEFYELSLVSFFKKICAELYGYNYNHLMLITDTMPFSRKRKIVEKNIKTQMADFIKRDPTYNDVLYKIYHHDSSAHIGLQIADYCGWAIQRHFEKQDNTYYKAVEPALAVYTDLVLPRKK